METPIQQLIDRWEQEKGSYIPNAPIFQEFINDAKEMLEAEQQSIQQAFYEGMLCQGFDPNMGRAEMYYNEIYKK